MISHTFIPANYPLLTHWWKGWGLPEIPLEYLSNTGLVISDEGLASCMGFIYSTNSALAWMEFLTADPLLSAEKRSLAVDLLIEKLCEMAKKMGFKSVLTTTVKPSLIQRCTGLGFRVSDENVTHLVRRF